MVFDESVSGYLTLDCTLRVPDTIGCMLGCLFLLGTLTCWLWWLFILIEDSDCGNFSRASLLYLFGALICWLCWLIILPRLEWWLWFCHVLFWSPHMHRLTIAYHLIWHDWFSRLYIISIFMEHVIVIKYSSWLACVYIWVIYTCFAWLSIAWLFSFLMWLHELCVYVGYTLIPLFPSP